jgi:hypothetical protein
MSHEQKTLSLERIFQPDSSHLGTLVSGLSGSGKTTAVKYGLCSAISSKDFGKKHRFVIVDPKVQLGDYDILADPITDLTAALASIRKNRVTVYWPDLEFLEEDTTTLIDHVFDLSAEDLETSFTFVIDEAATLIDGNRIPLAVKKLSVQGRSKRIMPIYISQRPILNRWTDSNMSNMLLFRILPVDADVLSKRWGLDFHGFSEQVASRPYSFIWFDLETAGINMMAPVPIDEMKEPVDPQAEETIKSGAPVPLTWFASSVSNLKL